MDPRVKPGGDGGVCGAFAAPSNSRSDVDLDDLFREVVDAVAGAVAADDVVIAQPVQIAAVRVGRMDDDVHVLLDRPRLVAANERPLDQIVALAVAIEPSLFRPAVLAHETVERPPDVLAG